MGQDNPQVGRVRVRVVVHCYLKGHPLPGPLLGARHSDQPHVLQVMACRAELQSGVQLQANLHRASTIISSVARSFCNVAGTSLSQ
jgi:hypothetical protein